MGIKIFLIRGLAPCPIPTENITRFKVFEQPNFKPTYMFLPPAKTAKVPTKFRAPKHHYSYSKAVNCRLNQKTTPGREKTPQLESDGMDFVAPSLASINYYSEATP